MLTAANVSYIIEKIWIVFETCVDLKPALQTAKGGEVRGL